MHARKLATIAACTCLTLTGCGGNHDSDSTTPSPTPSRSSTPTPSPSESWSYDPQVGKFGQTVSLKFDNGTTMDISTKLPKQVKKLDPQWAEAENLPRGTFITKVDVHVKNTTKKPLDVSTMWPSATIGGESSKCIYGSDFGGDEIIEGTILPGKTRIFHLGCVSGKDSKLTFHLDWDDNEMGTRETLAFFSNES